MKKFLGIAAIFLAASSCVHAEETTVADKAREVKEGVRDAVHQAGREFSSAGREVKEASKQAWHAVVDRFADGSHAPKCKGDCSGHGGVQDPK